MPETNQIGLKSINASIKSLQSDHQGFGVNMASLLSRLSILESKIIEIETNVNLILNN